MVIDILLNSGYLEQKVDVNQFEQITFWQGFRYG